MSLNTVKEYFKKYKMENTIIVLEESTATVHDAALALNTDEARIAKTLSFLVDSKPILIVTAGNTKIDNSLYKAFFKEKAKMIPVESVEELIGHSIGGVCPFGIKDNVTVYLDNSLKHYDYVYPACGSSNSAIKLTLPELEKYSNYKEWISVSKKI